MNTTGFAAQAAAMKSWPATREANGDVRIEVHPYPGRRQFVVVTAAKDGDGDPAAFVWSKCGDVSAVKDPLGLLRYNMQLTYGRLALRGNDVIVVHALHDASVTLNEVGKTIYWVARTADDIERYLNGVAADVM